jgi:arylsulfatase A-like enzyme
LAIRSMQKHALVFLALCLAACAADRPPESAPPRPNFILLYADDQGWPGLSVQMDGRRADSKSDFYRTPNLERMAAQGLTFARAYTGGPTCSPSRATLQTGLSTIRHGMTHIAEYKPRPSDRPLAPLPNKNNDISGFQTLPETLKQIDPAYRTAHFGKWHLLSGGPGQNGYDEHDGSTINTEGDVGGEDPKLTFSISRSGIDFMRRAAEDEAPFLLQLSYYAVHLEMFALESTREKYEGLPPGEKHTNPLYAAMTEDLDTGVGMILDAVQELGLGDNTYIVYTADNGAYVNIDQVRVKGEISNCLPLKKGKFSLYEGGVRVPMIVLGPGVPAGSRYSGPVSQADLYPTFAALAGSSPPKELDGVDITSILRAPEDAPVERTLFFHYPHYNRQATPHSAVIAGDQKLIRWWEDGSRELYDLGADLEETDNLADAEPERAAELAARLDAYLEQHGALIPQPQ